MITFDEAQIMAWLTPVLWPFLRVLAVFTAAPIFSSRSFPVRARILLALLRATLRLLRHLPEVRSPTHRGTLRVRRVPDLSGEHDAGQACASASPHTT